MYFLFNIGGTNTKVAMVGRDDRSVNYFEVFPTSKNYNTAINNFKRKILELSKGEKIEKVVGGIPGVLSTDRKIILDVYNLPNWNGKNLHDDLKNITGGEIYLENDCALEALGEATYGVGKDYQIVAYLSVGTGMGGARIVDKKIDAKKYSFEPGHQLIGIEKLQDLGDLISGAGLEKFYGSNPENIKDPLIWEKAERIFAQGIYNSILFWSPDVVVLGGGLILEGKIDLKKVKIQLDMLSKIYTRDISLIKSQLGNKSGLMGAFHLALN